MGQRAAPPGGEGSGAPSAGGQGDENRSGAIQGAERPASQEQGMDEGVEREFFDFPGPLHSAVISPSSVVMKVRSTKGFRCIARDRIRRPIDEGVDITWSIKEGRGVLSSQAGEIVTFTAPEEPGLTVLEAVARQADTTATAQGRITVSESLIEREPGTGDTRGKGLPGYTFLRSPGELWRSRYDEKNNLIIINNGHRDYMFAAQKHARKLKYICRLFAKELVLANFPGFESRELLERVIELSLYTEEHLK